MASSSSQEKIAKRDFLWIIWRSFDNLANSFAIMMSFFPTIKHVNLQTRPAVVIFLSVALLTAAPTMFAQQATSSRHSSAYSSKGGPVVRQYTVDDRIRYQLWDYTWKPDPSQPITRVEVRIGEQKVYVYQGDYVAAVSPITTGKPGHLTPTGHYHILVKDIDHKSNLYGVFLDANGNIVDGNASVGMQAPTGSVYDAADMPYYMRIRDDGVGMHAGFLPGYPASHGCIRLPNAFAELLYSNISLNTPVDVVP
jgi:lipoprotein-anchoring transpeptidase ErfK/SrfK